MGGTLLTIAGTGFGLDTSTLAVDIDGTPCNIASHNSTHITCWTSPPPVGSLAISDGDGSYSVADAGHRFRGNFYVHSFM